MEISILEIWKIFHWLRVRAHSSYQLLYFAYHMNECVCFLFDRQFTFWIPIRFQMFVKAIYIQVFHSGLKIYWWEKFPILKPELKKLLESWVSRSLWNPKHFVRGSPHPRFRQLVWHLALPSVRNVSVSPRKRLLSFRIHISIEHVRLIQSLYNKI